MDKKELYKQSSELLEQSKSTEFIELINSHLDLAKTIDLAYLYKTSCKLGNVEIVDYLLNFPHNNLINYDFPYHESQSIYEKSIPNGAFFLACDNKHLNLMEYFLKHDIYYLCSDTYEGLEQFMSGAIKDIDTIEHKLILEESLGNQTIKEKKIKI
jgi:hypothetical protein